MGKPPIECNSSLPRSSLKPSSDHHKSWAQGSTLLLTRSSQKTVLSRGGQRPGAAMPREGWGGSAPPAASHLLNLLLAAKDSHVCIRTPQLPG